MDAPRYWVIGERRGHELSPWTLELASGAADQTGADTGGVGVIIGDGPEIEALGACGVSLAVSVSCPAGRPPTVEELVSVATAQFADERPALVLVPDSLLGRDVATQLAAALDVPLLPACERLSMQDAETVHVIRSCFGGRLSTEVTAPVPVVATVREHTFRRVSRTALPLDVRPVKPAAAGQIRFVERRAPDPAILDLTEAEVVVGGGLGVGGAAGFELLQELATRLGGTTAASRPAVDQGWMPRERQVGQTGRSIAPRLYLACGISGQVQHMAGVRDAQTLIALNLDERAPIMREADLAAVGRVEEILPLLLRELSGSRAKDNQS